jgi:hypothetical protein
MQLAQKREEPKIGGERCHSAKKLKESNVGEKGTYMQGKWLGYTTHKLRKEGKTTDATKKKR